MTIKWLPIIILIYAAFGATCSQAGLSIKDWQFWMLLFLFILIDFVSFLGCREKCKKEKEDILNYYSKWYK
jgi:hypothetical protein